MLDQLVGLVKRDKVEGETIPCGSYLQDVPGTAQGNWFLSGIREKNPEDPHLARLHSNIHPARAVFSVGTSIRDLRSGKYEVLPVEKGLLDRDFKDITPDGYTYGFRVVRHDNIAFDGIVIVRMPDAKPCGSKPSRERQRTSQVGPLPRTRQYSKGNDSQLL